MRWTVGVVLFFALIFAMNAALIYIAVAGQEPVAPSYAAEQR
jgi:hypothetical protein